MKKYLVALSLFAMCLGAWAQADSCKKEKPNEFKFNLNYLTHGEIRGGGLPKPPSEDIIVEDRANFLMGRMRLNLSYKRNWLEAKAVIQNNAVWGSNSNMTINMYEAWVKATAKFGLFGQVGRIALSYDDERIIGPNDFAMASASHDVLRFGYEGHGHKVHAILAFNQNASTIDYGTYYQNGAQDYKSMQTLWYHYDIPKVPLGVSLLFMNVGTQAGEPGNNIYPPHTVYQQMYGGYVKYCPKYVTAEAAYYRQGGKTAMGLGGIDIKAWMASAKVSIDPSDRYGFDLGYDHLSGDDYVAVIVPGGLGMVQHTVLKGFTPLYGSSTKFYGLLDYFYQSAYINGFTPGLQDASAGVHGNPWPKLNLNLRYHYLATATKLENYDRTLGHSVELLASYRFTTDISLVASYTFMAGTKTMENLKQGEGNKHAHWGWFSLVISPDLFKTRW